MTAARVLLLLGLCSTCAHAEIYKCVASGALPLYQNFPCEFDRLASAPADTRTAAIATPAPPRASAGAGAATRSLPSVPQVGMTTGDVRAIWGEPKNSTKEELAKRDIEVWTYADSRSVEFDRKGIVTAIHW